jgi:hypothetical protein
MVEVGIAYKDSPRRKTVIEKNSTVVDREFDSLSISVEFFDLRIFLYVNFYMQTSASEFGQGHSTGLPKTVSHDREYSLSLYTIDKVSI